VLHRGVPRVPVDTIERVDGTRSERDIAAHPGAVAIVAIDPDGQVCSSASGARRPTGCCSRSRRHARRRRCGDADRDPDLAAPRELEEETGYRAGRWSD